MVLNTLIPQCSCASLVSGGNSGVRNCTPWWHRQGPLGWDLCNIQVTTAYGAKLCFKRIKRRGRETAQSTEFNKAQCWSAEGSRVSRVYGDWAGAGGAEHKPTMGQPHQEPLSSAAFLAAQGVHTEHTAELRGIRFTSLLQQENSDFYRLLTPALQTLASTAGAWRQGQLGRCWEGEVGLWGGQERPNALNPPTY